MHEAAFRGFPRRRSPAGGRRADSRDGRRGGRRPTGLIASVERLETRGMMAIDIPTVFVGNINNPADPETGYGRVDHAYRIGKFEVTLSQYAAFLNSVATVPAADYLTKLYNQDMAGDKVIGGTISRTGSGTIASPYA